jgi:hypothetical protein
MNPCATPALIAAAPIKARSLGVPATTFPCVIARGYIFGGIA